MSHKKDTARYANMETEYLKQAYQGVKDKVANEGLTYSRKITLKRMRKELRNRGILN